MRISPKLITRLLAGTLLFSGVSLAHQIEPIVDGRPYVIVREEPRADSVRVGILAPGEKAELLAYGEHWHLIRLSNSAEGFVSNEESRVIPHGKGNGSASTVTEGDIKETLDRIDKDVEATMDNMGLFLTVLAIVLTGLGLLGLGGAVQNIFLGRKASATLSEAQESASQAATIVTDAEEALDHVLAIKQGLSEVWDRADELAGRLPASEQSWTVRVETPDVDPETELAWRDFERLLVWADRLAISANPARTAAHYLSLAHAWRHYGHFSDSVVRAQRSIELDDSNWVAYRTLADALTLWVDYDVDFEFLDGDKEKEAQFKSSLLSRALSAAQDAKERWDGEDPICLNSLGWVYDTKGKLEKNRAHHETAVDYFKNADELAKKRRDDSDAAYDSTYLFNMMCALAGAGGDKNFGKAVKAAEELTNSGANMEKRLLDPDLAPILSDNTWGPKLRVAAGQSEET